MERGWIVVASADHVAIGRAGGFIQANHGKEAPMRRLHVGDGIACYSPTTHFGEKDALQSFTAIGRVADGELYVGEMGDGFHPWRRNVAFAAAKPAPIRPLLDELSFTAGKSSWGYAFRYGLFPIDVADFETIAKAMGATLVPGGA